MPPVTTRPLTGRMGWVKERGNPPRRGLSVAARTMQTEETPKRKRSSRPPRFLRPFRIRQAGKPVPRQRNETICCRLCPFKKLGQARAGRDRQRQARQAGTGKDRRDTEAEAKQSARPDSSGRSASGKPENLCPDSETKPSAADSARIKNSDRHGQAETDRSRQGRQKQAGHRSGSTPAARPDSSGRSASSKPENLCPE